MATFVKNGPCEVCGSRDNKATYDDGSTWCWGCHDYSPPTGMVFDNPKKETNVQLSDDLCYDFPRHVVEWLARYDISVAEALKHGWKYSPKWDQLTFIFRDGEGRPVCVQSRNFSPNAKRKYFNSGSVADVLPLFKSSNSTRTIVVVEDAVSAAKVSRQYDALPCLGSNLPVRKLSLLRNLGYEQIIVWLDSDKFKEACHIADLAKWIGLSARPVYTDLDPKEYSNKEIVVKIQHK